MPVVINGTTGISGPDGTAATPAVQGTDTNTGMFFPAADTIAFAEGGAEVMRMHPNAAISIPSNILNLGTSSLGTNGYTRLPNGLILQWGTSGSIGQDSSGSVTFPIAFTTLYCVTITPRASTNTGGGGADNITASSTTGFTISHGADGTATFYWMALGI